MTATIVAYATADHTTNTLAAINVTAFGSVLAGTYVLQTNGYDASGNPYQRAGVILLDGNGHITSGEQTVNVMNQSTSTIMTVADSITGGTYFVGPDGRGLLTINTNDQNLGVSPFTGIETFSMVVLSNAKVFIAATDPSSTVSTNELSTGSLDLQTSVAPPTAGYAFVSYGQNVSTFAGTSMALGGVLNIDSPQTISGNGSTIDEANNDGSGAILPGSPSAGAGSVSGTVSTPDAFGAVQITLNVPLFSATPIQFTGYIVDSSNIKLIETDDSSGAGFGVTAGIAIGQGSATGTFRQKVNFDGTYVFGLLGQDFSSTPFSLAGAGTFIASGGRISNGSIDESQSVNGVEFSTGLHGLYNVDTLGSGRVDTANVGTIVGPTLTLSQGQLGPGELVFYQTGNGNPALVLDADTESSPLGTGFSGGGLAVGLAYPVQANPGFAGEYGLSLVHSAPTDATAQFIVAGSSVSGAIDQLGSLDTQLTGTFTTSSTNNRLTGTLSNSLFPPNPNLNNQTVIGVAIYLIDPNHGFIVENDGSTLNFSANAAFAPFATRTPICQGCP